LQSTKGSIKTGPFGSELTNRDMEASDVKVYNQRTVLDQNFEKGEYYISNEKFNELKAFEVKPLDLLITTRGTIGKVAIVPKDVEKGILHPCLIRMQVNQSMVNLSYLEYIFNDTDLIKEQIYLLSNATTIEVIYSETLKNISIAIPNTIQEQNQIVEYLNRETFKIDQIINQVKLQVPKLKEYRQSLIYEAVTGKIDVQNIEIEA
jgi:type I restriction enzyme S subunit